MIARPKISQNEWKTSEIGAFVKLGMSLSFPAPDGAEEEVAELRGRPEVHGVVDGPEGGVAAPQEAHGDGRRQRRQREAERREDLRRPLVDQSVVDLGRKRVRNSQLQRLLSRPFSARFG